VDATLTVRRDLNFAGLYQQSWAATAPLAGAAPHTLEGLMVHELGHTLGLDHPHECDTVTNCCIGVGNPRPPDACGVAGNWKDSVLLSNNANLTPGATTIGFPNIRTRLWSWEYNAMRSDVNGVFRARSTCAANCCVGLPATNRNGYNITSDRRLRGFKSTIAPAGQTWSVVSLQPESSNADPAVEWGRADYSDNPGDAPSWCSGVLNSCPQFMVAWSGTDGNYRLYTRATNGTVWGAGAATQAGSAMSNVGPSLAYGNPAGAHTWLLAHRGKATDRQIYVQWSDDGVTWTAPSTVPDGAGGALRSNVPPAVAFAPGAGRFVLVYSRAAAAANASDQIAVALTNFPFASTWGTPVLTTGNAAGGHPLKGQTGLDVACENGVANCLITYKNDDPITDSTANDRWRDYLLPGFVSGGTFVFLTGASTAAGEDWRSGIAWGYQGGTTKYVRAALSGDFIYSWDSLSSSNVGTNQSLAVWNDNGFGNGMAYDPITGTFFGVHLRDNSSY